MFLPAWYGVHYPTENDLIMFAETLGAEVFLGCMCTPAYDPGEDGETPIILVPNQHGPLDTIWSLAHEIGHLCQHCGPKNESFHSKDEAQASRWAAGALIPQARIEHHGNASMDAFIAALSANYEPLPSHDSPARKLAYRIAKIRLGMLLINSFSARGF
jgi:hypothetical protein